MTESRRRRFVSVSRVLSQYNDTLIDAICEEGRAWWIVIGPSNATNNWIELLPLPRIEVEAAEQPAATIPASANRLVERVAAAIATSGTMFLTDRAAACAAIREVAAWLDSNEGLPDLATSRNADGWEMAAQILNQEADR